MPSLRPKLFHSVTEYITSILPPPPVIVPWNQAWHLRAPEFIDEPPSPSPVTSSSPSSPVTFTSFGEFASHVLVIRYSPITHHIA
jgi:hypothetical protein